LPSYPESAVALWRRRRKAWFAKKFLYLISVKVEEKMSLTEFTERRDESGDHTDRGGSRADMACKFLRDAKIYRPYSPSVLSVCSSESYERVRENLKLSR